MIKKIVLIYIQNNNIFVRHFQRVYSRNQSKCKNSYIEKYRLRLIYLSNKQLKFVCLNEERRKESETIPLSLLFLKGF